MSPFGFQKDAWHLSIIDIIPNRYWPELKKKILRRKDLVCYEGNHYEANTFAAKSSVKLSGATRRELESGQPIVPSSNDYQHFRNRRIT